MTASGKGGLQAFSWSRAHSMFHQWSGSMLPGTRTTRNPPSTSSAMPANGCRLTNAAMPSPHITSAGSATIHTAGPGFRKKKRPGSAGFSDLPICLTSKSLTDFHPDGDFPFISQQLAWHQQKFMLKYSFHQTAYAAYRPNLLGNNLIQNMIKDYNGHTYWISGNIRSFCHEESKFPKWLNVAVGYGAEGMTGAFSNAESTDGHQIPAFTRYRKFFLSVDVDLTRIPTKSPFLRTMFTLLSFIKIPAPAIGYSTQGSWSFYPLYY